MATLIFSYETGSEERWLWVQDDGTLLYETENSGWTLQKNGIDKREKVMTAEDAKRAWPQYVDKIDAALAELKSGPASN